MFLTYAASTPKIVCLFRLRQGAVQVTRGCRRELVSNVLQLHAQLGWNGACHSATGPQRGMVLRLA